MSNNTNNTNPIPPILRATSIPNVGTQQDRFHAAEQPLPGVINHLRESVEILGRTSLLTAAETTSLLDFLESADPVKVLGAVAAYNNALRALQSDLRALQIEAQTPVSTTGSFLVEALGVGEDPNGRWGKNALRFATEAEAAAYGDDLYCRWTGCAKTRVAPSTDPVNYRWLFDSHQIENVG